MILKKISDVTDRLKNYISKHHHHNYHPILYEELLLCDNYYLKYFKFNSSNLPNKPTIKADTGTIITHIRNTRISITLERMIITKNCIDFPFKNRLLEQLSYSELKHELPYIEGNLKKKDCLLSSHCSVRYADGICFELQHRPDSSV